MQCLIVVQEGFGVGRSGGIGQVGGSDVGGGGSKSFLCIGYVRSIRIQVMRDGLFSYFFIVISFWFQI